MANRKQVLEEIKIAGYHNDSKKLTELYVLNRISYNSALDAFELGNKLKKSGMKCACFYCKSSPL